MLLDMHEMFSEGYARNVIKFMDKKQRESC